MREPWGRVTGCSRSAPARALRANYLLEGRPCHALDIDAEDCLDIVANVAQYDFPETYDAILVLEVFVTADDYLHHRLGKLDGGEALRLH